MTATHSREDDELARALEMSKRSAEEEANNHRTKNAGDADLEEAMRLSREEDERRKRELENSRGGLFDQDAQKCVRNCSSETVLVADRNQLESAYRL